MSCTPGHLPVKAALRAVLVKLPYLSELGVTAVELMPVSEFPGARNWGYDGVDLYAPHSAYGGPNGLKAFVDAAHGAGLAVVLDVVYNHLGPEGNYLAEFGPYFTDQYRTPWGPAINFDGPGSDGVRRFFIDNALYWLTEYHIDALRLDAIHGIYDFSAFHILAELSDRFHQEAARLGRAGVPDRRKRSKRRSRHPTARQWRPWPGCPMARRIPPLRQFGAYRSEPRISGWLRQDQADPESSTDGFVYDGIYSRYRQRRFGSSSRQ